MSEEPTLNLGELIQQMNGAKTLSEFMEAYSKAQAENTDMYRYGCDIWRNCIYPMVAGTTYD